MYMCQLTVYVLTAAGGTVTGNLQEAATQKLQTIPWPLI